MIKLHQLHSITPVTSPIPHSYFTDWVGPSREVWALDHQRDFAYSCIQVWGNSIDRII